MNNSSPEGPDSGVVRVYDTTLRDGTQGEGVSLTVADKLRIARRLDQFGVAFIEGGWPGSNPKDAEFFARARDEEWKTSKIAAFGSTRRAKVAPEDDANLKMLIDAGTPVCTVFGKSWTLHVTEVIRTTLDNNLTLIEDSCAFLKAQGRRVIFDAEHFFDGYAADASYACECLQAAIRGGAEVLVLCDTNGGGVPWRVLNVVKEVVAKVNHPIGIHAHNDTGCAVANSLTAVRAGARHIQGTVNGYGERCGNANLTVAIPNLELKLNLRCLPEGHLRELGEVSRYVAEIANMTPDESMPYVGRSAFAHKGGVHVAAMRRHGASYQHIDPELVGNSMRVLVSELSGRGNVLSKAEELGVNVDGLDEVAALQALKESEARGFSYEGAEASFAMLLERRKSDHRPLFTVVEYQVIVGMRQGSEQYSEATVKVLVGDRTYHTAGDGIGPVAALDCALRKALVADHPTIEQIHLADYKVRILDGAYGTEAATRVLIDNRDEHNRFWSTVGASHNIIEASLQAVVDGLEYGLRQNGLSDTDCK